MTEEEFNDIYEHNQLEYIASVREANMAIAYQNAELVFNALQMVYNNSDIYTLKIPSHMFQPRFGYSFEMYVVKDNMSDNQIKTNECLIHVYVDNDVNSYHIDQYYENDKMMEIPGDGKSHYNTEYFREYNIFLKELRSLISDQPKDFKTWLALSGLYGLVEGDRHGTK